MACCSCPTSGRRTRRSSVLDVAWGYPCVSPRFLVHDTARLLHRCSPGRCPCIRGAVVTRRTGPAAGPDRRSTDAGQGCPERDSNPHGPFGPGGFKPPAPADYATRAGRPETTGPRSRPAAMRRRARMASCPRSAFATRTPSMRSATTSVNGRPRIATATTGPRAPRRIVLTAPARPGGARNPGTRRPKQRA
jgi:hypothetical protein